MHAAIHGPVRFAGPWRRTLPESVPSGPKDVLRRPRNLALSAHGNFAAFETEGDGFTL